MLMLLVFSTQALAQKPLIVCEKSTHNFGDIQESKGKARHTFVVKNVGKAPLVINNCAASCGCTTPTWTKSPIAPGKTGKVDVVYDTKDRPGQFSKTVSVYSNATKKPLILTIRGNVIE